MYPAAPLNTIKDLFWCYSVTLYCLVAVSRLFTALLFSHLFYVTGGQDNKVEHNLLLQQISTVDENGQAVVKGTKVSRGYYADNGPPTTLSGTGKDVSLSYQGFAAVDNVQFVNGNQLGTRLLFQVSGCWVGLGGWGPGGEQGARLRQ